MKSNIILASQSPRRKELLHLAEVQFDVVVANTDETYPLGLSFTEIAMHIAKDKAAAVCSLHKQSTIIAADTIVVCNNTIIGKPADSAHAKEILQTLSGNVHQVITGVSIMHPKYNSLFAETTTVHFNPLTDTQINYYINKYKPYDKAGAYAIQEWIGAIGIKKIEGDFYNVMGLPISRVVAVLNSL